MTTDTLIIGSVSAVGTIFAGVYYLDYRLKKKVKVIKETIDKCRQFIDGGNYDIAVFYGKRAVEILPKEPYAYYCLAMVYFYAGNTKLALENFKKAEKLVGGLFNLFNPISIPLDKTKFYMDYAKVLESEGMLDDAAKYYERALTEARRKRKEDEIKEILQRIADAYLSAGKLDVAAGYYKELLPLTTDKHPIYEKLAFIYKKLDNKEITNDILRTDFEENAD